MFDDIQTVHPCPTCHARPGDQCILGDTHQERIDLLEPTF